GDDSRYLTRRSDHSRRLRGRAFATRCDRVFVLAGDPHDLRCRRAGPLGEQGTPVSCGRAVLRVGYAGGVRLGTHRHPWLPAIRRAAHIRGIRVVSNRVRRVAAGPDRERYPLAHWKCSTLSTWCPARWTSLIEWPRRVPRPAMP